jgi:hypothetical protein
MFDQYVKAIASKAERSFDLLGVGWNGPALESLSWDEILTVVSIVSKAVDDGDIIMPDEHVAELDTLGNEIIAIIQEMEV